MYILGIDPGVSGGLAFLDCNGALIRAVRMPETERDLWDALDPGVEHGICYHAAVERVGSFPGMGCVSAFTFGRGFGALLMALTARQYPFDLVQPAKWQQALGCLSRGDKNITKRRAQQLFPRATVTHAVADAMLIAEYCRRQLKDSNRGKEKEGARTVKQGRR